MAATEAICRDVGHVVQRVFDHKAALQGQQRFFFKEFETKRGFRECKRLEQVKTVAQSCSETLSSEAVTSLLQQLEEYEAKAAEVMRSLDGLMKEKSIEAIEKGCNKEKLSDNWQLFVDNMAERRMKFDADIEEELATARKQLNELKLQGAAA